MAENETPEGFKRNMRTLAADLANGKFGAVCFATMNYSHFFCSAATPLPPICQNAPCVRVRPRVSAERNSVTETLEKAWSWVHWVDAEPGRNRSTPWHQDHMRIVASYDISRSLLKRKTCASLLCAPLVGGGNPRCAASLASGCTTRSGY